MASFLEILAKRPILGIFFKRFLKQPPAEVTTGREYYADLHGPPSTVTGYHGGTDTITFRNWPGKHNRNKYRVKRAKWKMRGGEWNGDKPRPGDIPSLWLNFPPMSADPDKHHTPGKAPGT
jgi:hypothetical protein